MAANPSATIGTVAVAAQPAAERTRDTIYGRYQKHGNLLPRRACGRGGNRRLNSPENLLSEKSVFLPKWP
jgi:hypothetical protein